MTCLAFCRWPGRFSCAASRPGSDSPPRAEMTPACSASRRVTACPARRSLPRTVNMTKPPLLCDLSGVYSPRVGDASLFPERPRPCYDHRRRCSMTWIKTIPPQSADEQLLTLYKQLGEMYPPEYFGEPIPSLVRPDGTSDSIAAAHSLIPEAMFHLMGGLAALLRPDLGLTRRQQEMIASVVSARNSCFY